MEIHIEALPCEGDEQALADFNRWLRSVRVLGIDKTLIQRGGQSYWSIFVEYLPRRAGGDRERSGEGRPRSSVDYREVLDAATFARFSCLREARRTLAERDGVPVYTVVTNAQLADIAIRQPRTLAELAAVDGLGKSRLDKYGAGLLEALGSAGDGDGELAADRVPGGDAARAHEQGGS